MITANFSPEDIDEIISRSNYQHKGDVGLMMEKVNGKNRTQQRKKATEGVKVKPGELLKPLMMALTGETIESGFPYLWLTRSSWGIMRGLKKACDPILRRLHGPTYLDDESQLPTIAALILQEFCNDPEGNGRQLMLLAAGAFDFMLTEKGLGDETVRRFSELYGLRIKSDTDLINESHDRWHERDDMIPAEDCNWMDCGWSPDWELGNDEEDDDNES
ncbi:unnamed protein product [Fusarium equiseti]|uniref:Uncharacterized protein n=1 Tax=Fusarium equiseti TaxID=61235 RepID=A0A8J2J3V4_FUSEQ|nr:unnamed protein product [Fusarium equiseti]